MTSTTIVWWALLGFGLLVAGGFAARYLITVFKGPRLGTSWLLAECCVALGGIALGCTLSTLRIPVSEKAKTLGFPFLSAVFELHDGRWEDYVGVITLPAAIGNFVVGVLVPHLLFAVLIWLYLKKDDNKAGQRLIQNA